MKSQLHGAELIPFEDSPAVLDWLWGETSAAPDSLKDTLAYGVLQCTDSFVWGICTEGVWRWSSSVEPHTPQNPGVIAPTTRTLLEARLFGVSAELLLWRSSDFDAETFHGRVLRDGEAAEEFKPLDETLAFSSAHIDELGSGFMRRTELNGCITVTPQGSGVRLRHYLAEDPTTGVLRIAATRFVTIEATCSNEENQE